MTLFHLAGKGELMMGPRERWLEGRVGNRHLGLDHDRLSSAAGLQSHLALDLGRLGLSASGHLLGLGLNPLGWKASSGASPPRSRHRHPPFGL